MLKPNHVQTKIIWPDSVLKNKTRLSFLLLDKWNFLLFQSQGFNFSICSQISARDVTRNNQPSWDWKNLGFTRGAPKPGLVLVPWGWTLLELQWQSCHVLRWPPSQLQPPETSGANGYAYAFFFSLREGQPKCRGLCMNQKGPRWFLNFAGCSWYSRTCGLLWCWAYAKEHWINLGGGGAGGLRKVIVGGYMIKPKDPDGIRPHQSMNDRHSWKCVQ